MLNTDHENPDWKNIPVWHITTKLGDFGLSKRHSRTLPDESFTTSEPCGSAKYMSPEMFEALLKGQPDLVRGHGRLDIFSAGVLAYYLYTGKGKDGNYKIKEII